jgi:AcrR family transcriptional regulator
VARPQTIPDEQILDAAREVFLAEGPGASTADIARRAGVSEGLLFKRFETKERLFVAAMGCRAPPWHAELERLAGKGDLRENLERLAAGVLEANDVAMPRLAMQWAAKVSPGACPDGEPHSCRDIKLLAAFFEREIAAGRLRPCDSEVLARAFLGALLHHGMFEMLGVNRRLPIARATFVRAMVDQLWAGVRP